MTTQSKVRQCVYLVLLIMLSNSCGSSKSATQVDLYTTKDLFSKWTDVTNLLSYIDASSGKFSGTTATLPVSVSIDGTLCNCTAVISGTQSSGTCVLSDCGTGCGSLIGTLTYDKTDTQLKMCTANNSCTTYR